MFYLPTQLAGPVLPFNAFHSYLAAPQTTHSSARLLRYGAGWLLCLGAMELLTHAAPAMAVASSGAYAGFEPLQLMMFSFVLLKLIWLKFLIIWRFFRLWALLDGVETPENMSRWMTDNYTLRGFWRGWHCSFNRWLVRYIYVPAGGSDGGWVVRMRNIFGVFSFVAIWHDMTLQLLLWGWLSAIAFAPELLVEWLGSRPSVRAAIGGRWWYANLVALLGALNVLLLIVANMIGFATAAGGTASILAALATAEGAALLGAATVMLYNGVLVMLEIRAAEGLQQDRGGGSRRRGRSRSPSPAVANKKRN